MSQLIEKAKTLEEKGKAKNAASVYYEAGQNFLSTGAQEEAITAFKKAFDNAQEENLAEFIVDIAKALCTVETKNEVAKQVIEQSLKPLDELIAMAKEKKKFDELIAFSKQKIAFLEAIEHDSTEAKKALGVAYQLVAKENIINKKPEERAKAQEYLSKASELFMEINDVDTKLSGEIEITTVLLNAGFVTEALEIFNSLVDFCSKDAIYNEHALQLCDVLISQGEAILLGSGPKKLLKSIKENLSQSDPGAAFFEKIITKALELGSNEKIIAIADIFSEYASAMFQKKKYDISHNSFEKALQLHINISSKETAIKQADMIIKKALELLDMKGKFEAGLEFYSIINLTEAVDKQYLGDRLIEKAEELQKRGLLKQTLDELLITAKLYLDASR